MERINNKFDLIKSKKKIFDKKRIAIYGTGENAKELLSVFLDYNVVCFLDGKKENGYFLGKRILCLNEIVILKVDVIIIAAEDYPTTLVSSRIISFCVQNGIELYNLYGGNEIDRTQDMYLQDCQYLSMTAESLNKIISQYKSAVICAKHTIIEPLLDEIELYDFRNYYIFRRSFYELIRSSIEDNDGCLCILEGLPDKCVEFFFELEEKDTSANWIIGGNQTGMSIVNHIKENKRVEEVVWIAGFGDETTLVPHALGIRIIYIKSVFEMLKEIPEYQLDIQRMIQSNKNIDWKSILCNYMAPFYDNFIKLPQRKERRKKNRKNIVFICHSIPAYDRDAGSRTIYEYVLLMKKKNYEVTVVSTVDLYDYEKSYRDLGINTIVAQTTVIKEWIVSMGDSLLLAFVSYPLVMKEYLFVLRMMNIPIAYYGVDLHYIRLDRQYELEKKEDLLKRVKEYYFLERKLNIESDVAYYPSVDEAIYAKKEFGSNTKYLVPFMYKHVYTEFQIKKRKGLLFVGGFKHFPNVDAMRWFLKQVFPAVWNELKIPFYIVGSNEPEELMKYEVPGVIHRGYVTDEKLESIYREVRIVVVPLRYGAGIKGKVIEAMYYGVPVISTSIGLEGVPEKNSLITEVNEVEDFSKTIIASYNDEELLKQTSIAEQRIIQKYYSENSAWESVKEMMYYDN